MGYYLPACSGSTITRIHTSLLVFSEYGKFLQYSIVYSLRCSDDGWLPKLSNRRKEEGEGSRLTIHNC